MLNSPSSRRDILRKAGLAGSLVAIPALAGIASNRANAGVPADDADLLRLGEEFGRLYAGWLPINAEWKRLRRIADAAWKAKQLPFTWEEWEESNSECGEVTVRAANEDYMDRLDELSIRIDVVVATSFAGIAVKLKVIRYNAFTSRIFNRPDGDLDWDVRYFVRVQREVEALAGRA